MKGNSFLPFFVRACACVAGELEEKKTFEERFGDCERVSVFIRPQSGGSVCVVVWRSKKSFDSTIS